MRIVAIARARRSPCSVEAVAPIRRIATVGSKVGLRRARRLLAGGSSLRVVSKALKSVVRQSKKIPEGGLTLRPVLRILTFVRDMTAKK
jgi:siroheme synthase (precorrin-2 oxidase/ferrochelatase)